MKTATTFAWVPVVMAVLCPVSACRGGPCDPACSADQRCIGGRCLKPCADNSECGQNEVCFRGYCEIGNLRPDLLGDADNGDANNGDANSGDPSNGDSASPVCGDETAQGMEACDGPDLRGWDACIYFGYFGGGSVGCLPTCAAYDLSACAGPGYLCGNGKARMGEQCDGSDLSGATCETLGYANGVLACHPNCSFDVTGCVGP